MSRARSLAGRALFDRIRTACSLGVVNVARVAAYRVLLRTGLHPVQHLPRCSSARGPFYRPATTTRHMRAPSAWRDTAMYFGWHRPPLSGGPPDWHRNPFSGQTAAGRDAEWWMIPDFDPLVGDVKAIWEASRLDWVVNLAQRGAIGQAEAIERLNAWLGDWWSRNPCYRGHNWKCAQEASIRVMHLALAALFLGEMRTPLPSLVELLVAHLRRIEPTLSYAIGQDNNHGTSEATALFIGGSWLLTLGMAEGARWVDRGRKLMERLAARLIREDGSFSQYSLNYHRLILDTLGLGEVFRRHLELPPFRGHFYARAAAATRWLQALVDPETGDAPNYGANDGACLLPLTDADVRDYRPAVALAAALFESRNVWSAPGPWQDHLEWLGLRGGLCERSPQTSVLFKDGGQVVLRSGEARTLMVFPRYRFRPSHCDALHVDLSLRGEAVLGDAGTFSYAADPELLEYFAGARGHNTVQFDEREQMPRLGRFLRGPWLPDATVGPVDEAGDSLHVTAAYADAEGAFHERSVALEPSRLTVRDRIRGFRSKAVLRWRLRPGEWRVDGASVSDGQHRLALEADVPIVRFVLVAGWESRYYMCKRETPVCEVEVAVPGTLTTRYSWSPPDPPRTGLA